MHELTCVMKDELVNFTFCVSMRIMLCIDMCLVKSWKMLIVEHFSFYSIILSNMKHLHSNKDLVYDLLTHLTDVFSICYSETLKLKRKLILYQSDIVVSMLRTQNIQFFSRCKAAPLML